MTPARLAVSVAGPLGRQKILIRVAAADGTVIPHAYVVIRDGDQFFYGQTGDDGTLGYQARFTEERRPFDVRAGSTADLAWRVRLRGPKRRRTSARRPRATPGSGRNRR